MAKASVVDVEAEVLWLVQNSLWLETSNERDLPLHSVMTLCQNWFMTLASGQKEII